MNNMKKITGQQIAIIGGGPGGLTLARLLQQKGFSVKVYERDANEHVRVQGATLDLHVESGLRALEAAGLMEAFRKHYRPGADKLRIADQEGNLLLDEPMNDEETLFRPEIDRGPLRRMLLDSLQPGTVVWDSHLTRLERSGVGWQLDFQNGNTATAYLVIGADGARSLVRPLVTDVQPFYSGITMVEGSVYESATTVPLLHQRLDGGKLFVLGDEKTLVLSAKGDGSLVFYTGSRLGEDWWRSSGIDFGNKEQVLSWFRQAFMGWDESWSALFEQAALPLIPRPQYCMPPDQYWAPQPDITLLGDAAHLMPPYAGEGVNMAMLDALELSLCLSGDYDSMQQAIAAYETGMRGRAGEAARLTLLQTEALHSAGAMAHLLSMFDGQSS